jgi:hypothetical protein
LHIAQHFERGPIVVVLPEQVGEKEEKSDCGTNPQPFVSEKAACWRQQQPDKDTETEEEHRVLIFKTQPRQESKPEPIPRVISVDGANDTVGTPHPKNWLEGVHGKQGVDAEVARSNQHTEAGEHHREASAAKFSNHQSGQEDFRCASHCR